eukprot:CAMPEP_0185590534 /NCGR_PEP_ID=MMETSP0434-20130131/61071_1 /TAXON_ID=626734 ORGANISM="Favella taraikaensis, Strain Fe Narragansett Bay" /NCGR_SAMPLE_ID=MMETSP0434 /ASSEMBLY_ACC=CAM_ASM_000379 /LENGTH=35 /DNA_ID= /DNA_START= /DNA_END= /DNA_ORIENTATION=
MSNRWEGRVTWPANHGSLKLTLLLLPSLQVEISLP